MKKKLDCWASGHKWIRSFAGITMFYCTHIDECVFVCEHCGHKEIASVRIAI